MFYLPVCIYLRMVRLFINPTLHLKNICHNQLIKSYSREKKMKIRNLHIFKQSDGQTNIRKQKKTDRHKLQKDIQNIKSI